MLKSHEAIKAVREGQRIARSGWNGKGMFVYLETGLVHSFKVTAFKPVLVLHTATGDRQPGWVFSQDDLLSDDWEIIQ